MPSRPSCAAWFIALSLVAGCQPTDISSEIDQYAYLLNDGVSLTCDCPEDVGHTSYGECVDALGYVEGEDLTCLSGVLEGYEDEGKEYLDCANVALQAYADCLEANSGCQDGWYEDCTEVRGQALDACPQLPSEVRQSFALCTV